MNETTDEVLFQQYMAGDERAFDALYHRYAEMLRRYVRQKIRRDRDTCDEIVQQTFVRIVKNRHRFTVGKFFRPWLYTIAHRLCCDWLKNISRRAKHVRLFSECDLLLTEYRDGAKNNPTDAILRDPRLSPIDEQLIDHEEGRKAMKLLRKLPPHLRNAIELLVLQGSPGRAAGPLLYVSYVQAQTRRKMGLDILRKQLESDEAVESGDDSGLGMEATIRDLVDAMPELQRESLARAIFHNSGEGFDTKAFSTFIRRLVGETV